MRSQTPHPPPHPKRRWLRWLRRILLLCSGTTLLLGVVVGVAVYACAYPVHTLAPEAGGPLIITDRHGVILRSIPNPQGRPGRVAWVPLAQVPTEALHTLFASEDLRFFAHPGVDVYAMLRALWLNLSAGRVRYGGSTITMQLIRLVHSQGKPRTLWRKCHEMLLALRLERAMSKRAILEQYLNRAYYGHGAYGIAAASQRFFGKPARSLSSAEATLLGVLPRGPTRYDLIRHLPQALARRKHIFALLQKGGWLTPKQRQNAQAQRLQIRLYKPAFHAPHFVEWVVGRIPQALRRQGGIVRTTLDLTLQKNLSVRVRMHVKGLYHRGLRQAGMVVLDTKTGQILAMIGSKGRASPSGHLNITTTRRPPGSTLKPLIYAMALEAGDWPGRLVKEGSFTSLRYKMHKQVKIERGLVMYREALASSYNAAAMRVLETHGVDRFVDKLQQARLGPFPHSIKKHGLELAVGAAKVRLLDLAAAYGFLARGGKIKAATGLLGMTLPNGVRWHPPARPERQLFSPEVSWQIMSILSDPQARRKVFGFDLPFDLPYRIAAKTGTALGIADTLALGVTNEFTVAAWGGRFDGAPTYRLTGIRGAAPLVRAGLLAASRGRRLTLPKKPKTLKATRLCRRTGLPASPTCPFKVTEYTKVSHTPPRPCQH